MNSPLTESLLPLACLPAEVAARATASFHALGCTESHLTNLTTTLVEIATIAGIDASVALGQTFALLVAASHSIGQLSSPRPPFAADEDHALTATEWLLLATCEHARSTFTVPVSTAIAEVIAELARVAAKPAGTNAAVLDDYGFGKLLAAVLESSDEPVAAQNAGQLMGKLTRLSFEIHRITKPERDLSYPYVLRNIATEVGLGPRLSLALALANKPGPNKLPLVSVLGHPLVWARISQLCTSWTNEATLAVQAPVGDVVRRFMTTTSEVVTRKTSGVRLFGFASAPSLAAELDRTIRLAVEALEADPELREAWEIQRWGGIFPRTCVGRFFPLSLCTIALASASVDVSSRARTLLSLGSIDGYRYFEGFAGIAPDADDLGMALQLVSRLPREPDAMQTLVWPVELLVKNTSAEGEIPVWLDRYLREPIAEDAPAWRGSRCLAVAANATIGLIEAGVLVASEFIERSLGWITRTWRQEGMRAVFFYGLAYTRLMLMRLHEVTEGQTFGSTVTGELRSIAEDIQAEIVAAQRSDGGFGGLMDTACSLGALACVNRASFDPWPAVAFLASRQQYDGLWASEPLYPTPGKDNVPAAHGSRAITTALCLYALARTRSRLALQL